MTILSKRGAQLPLVTATAAGAQLVPSEIELIRLAVDLGATEIGGALSSQEKALVRASASGVASDQALLDLVRRSILAGQDPLGHAFCALRSPAVRRQNGAIYTPSEIVRPMVAWTLAASPSRVIDAGSGSGRFALEVWRNAPRLPIIAIDADPVATLLTRAALRVAEHKDALVLNSDYTTVRLPAPHGRTAFIGNPPYVRHHNLAPRLKDWAQAAARQLDQTISGLAGLHAYFFLSTALLGAKDDVGCFVTSSEWLDVNYGAIIRELLLDGLGGQSVHILEPTAAPFEQAATTAAITCFKLGDRPKSLRLRRVRTIAEIDPLQGGRPISRERLTEARRWTPLVRASRKVPEGHIELGELCRVHRGAVTGSNSVWIIREEDASLPARVLYAAITRARELFSAGHALLSSDGLRRVIDLPEDLDMFDADERRAIDRFLRRAKKAGAGDGYIARYRKAWWSVGLREPAPILATYMARRVPAFVRNLADARHVNIAHGLYPRVDLPPRALDRLADALRESVTLGQGRTYSGGLTKFEPKEMERLPVPDLPMLLAP